MLHTLNCRLPNVNGSVRKIPDADATTWHALRTADRCVIFIHGFANDEAEATAKYGQKRGQLEAAFALGDAPDTTTAYFGFYWPGDHLHSAENLVTFSVRIPVAGLAGGSLAQALLAHPPAGEVVLIAHSLGCRVLLDCLETLAFQAELHHGQPSPRIVAAALMAGAVPVSECATDSPVFGRRYPGTWYTNLHSERDRVLQLSFPAGQQFVDRSGIAIGRHGDPGGKRWDQRFDTRLGHTRYWSSTQTGDVVAISAGAVHVQNVSTHPLPENDVAEYGLRSSTLPAKPSLG